MKKIKTILACVDFSQYTMMTLEYAVSLARGSDVWIVVFNAINQRDVNNVESLSHFHSGKIDAEIYVRDITKERREKLDLFINTNFPDEKTRMSVSIDVGIPWESIIRAAQTHEADLIVMANKGRGNLSRVLFGSAAEKVFRHSPVPVVSVRNKDTFKGRQ